MSTLPSIAEMVAERLYVFLFLTALERSGAKPVCGYVNEVFCTFALQEIELDILGEPKQITVRVIHQNWYRPSYL